MPQFKIWLAAAALGLAAVLLLGRFADLQQAAQTRHLDAAVAPSMDVTLTDDNLPDAIVSLRLKLRVTRVGWDHRRLTVDLLMPDGDRGAESLWHDLAAIIRFSFGEAGNVRQTLVRIHRETDNGRRVLMFYGDPSRAEWPAERIAALNAPDRGSADAFRRQIGLSATPAGETWLADM